MAQHTMGTVPRAIDPADRPLRDLLVGLWQDTEKLVRQEVKLASTELDGKIQKVKVEATVAAIGGAALYAGVLALVAAAILLLSQVMASWLAALIVGVVVATIGFVLARRVKNVTADAVKPEHAIRSVKQDMRTFKEAMR